MHRTTADQGIKFRCPIDGTIAPGKSSDTRLDGGGGDGQIGRISQLYRTTLNHAPHDATTERVAKQCPDCSLPYLRRVEVGSDAASVFYVCNCGYGSPAASASGLKSTEELLRKLAQSAGAVGDTDSKGSED
jgi:predicted RNA-binding Zn-ribbon protein involved in translation (DUF1610 family)